LKEAAEKLGVARGTLRYYLDKLEIASRKFPLDKHLYILYADYERIRMYKQEAKERSEEYPDLVVEQMNRIESPGYNELGEDEPMYVHPEDR
jgi:hypothetical protein